MNTRIKRILAVLSISLLLPASMTLPVFAEGGSNSGTGDTAKPTDSSTSPTERSGSTTKVKKTEAEVRHAAEMENETETEVHDRGKKILDDAKKNGKEHTKEERLKNCTDRQKGLENKLTNIQKRSASHLAKIDAVLAKIEAAQASATTPLAGYDALLTTAKAAQVQATASVAALGNLSPKIDCTKDTAAAEIATFKAAADKAKYLKAYRDAVKSILKAIETAAGDQ